MGTSRNVAQLVEKLERYGLVVGRANREAVSGAAWTYKQRLLRAAERDTGGDRRLSQWRTRNGSTTPSPKLGAGYELFGYENAKAVLRPRPYGIWSLLEGGASPHRIRPRSGRGAKRKVLSFPGGGFAAYADHPGTPPKRTFTEATAGAEPAAMRVFAEAHRRSLLETFK